MSILSALRHKIKAFRDALKNPGRQSSSVYTKYPESFQFDGKKVLNIGCGFAQYKFPNVVNLDAEANCRADVTWDLNKAPLPFKDEEFDMIIANHIFEHVDNWWECFKDCGRILKTGGRFEVWLPGNGSDSQLGYRDHVSMVNQCSFAGISGFYRNFGNAWEIDQFNKEVNRLQMVGQYVNMSSYWWIALAPRRLKNWCATHLRNVVYEMGFVLTKLPEKDLGLQEEGV